MSDVKKFPGHRWSPDGEHRIFQSAEEMPEGWTDYHPGENTEKRMSDEKNTEKRINTAANQPTRPQIIAELARRGVVFQRNAATKALYDLLVAEVERSEA